MTVTQFDNGYWYATELQSDQGTFRSDSPRQIHQLRERLLRSGETRDKRTGNEGLEEAENAGRSEELSCVGEIPVTETEVTAFA
jgi:hypothetical protein